MRPSTAVPTALNRTRTALELFRSGAAWLGGRALAAVRRLAARLEDLVRGPIGRFARGPLRTILFGRRRAVSVALLGVAVLLGVVAAWSVATTTGYPPLERWLVETWDGTNPHAVVFVGSGLLVTLAAGSAAFNAGLLPTTALAAAPLFGLTLTRYGTVVSTRYGQYVVSLPEALAFAAGVAAVGGSVAGVVGYALGAGLRRAVRVVAADLTVPIGPRRNDD